MYNPMTFTPEFSREAWMKVKPTMGLDFPNLPYYKDGKVKLTQSNAIMSYVAEKHGLGGYDAQERAQLACINGAVVDLRMGLVRTCYNPNFATLKVDFEKTLPTQLKTFSDFLASKPWLFGDKITYPDFNLYDLLDTLKVFSPGCLDEFDNLKKYIERFEALPSIKTYMASSDFIRRPFTGKIAQWGGDK